MFTLYPLCDRTLKTQSFSNNRYWPFMPVSFPSIFLTFDNDKDFTLTGKTLTG